MFRHGDPLQVNFESDLPMGRFPDFDPGRSVKPNPAWCRLGLCYLIPPILAVEVVSDALHRFLFKSFWNPDSPAGQFSW